ncbi:glutathione S-transferase [Rhodobacter sp. NSM]|uniref:glutathione S-transferase n=1 Tax=Rhodobacter sp. NSM TaxID=3457501 RepID=UPI003FD3D05E
MRLYASATSPFVRKVDVVLYETGLADRVERVMAGGTPVDPGSLPLALNPLGKIPVLGRDDGPAIYDSRVICRYLDSLANAGLYPQPPRLWDALTLEATADGILEAAVLMVYEVRTRPEAKRHEPWVEGQWNKISRALEAVESRWMSHLHGPLDIGQIAMGCALDYLDFRHGPRDWRGSHPTLATWAQSFSQRPSMLATVPVG